MRPHHPGYVPFLHRLPAVPAAQKDQGHPRKPTRARVSHPEQVTHACPKSPTWSFSHSETKSPTPAAACPGVPGDPQGAPTCWPHQIHTAFQDCHLENRCPGAAVLERAPRWAPALRQGLSHTHRPLSQPCTAPERGPPPWTVGVLRAGAALSQAPAASGLAHSWCLIHCGQSLRGTGPASVLPSFAPQWLLEGVVRPLWLSQQPFLNAF